MADYMTWPIVLLYETTIICHFQKIEQSHKSCTKLRYKMILTWIGSEEFSLRAWFESPTTKKLDLVKKSRFLRQIFLNLIRIKNKNKIFTSNKI